MTFSTSRRHLLMAGATLFASPYIPKAWAAGPAGASDQRLLVIILRGGLDGLGAVMPTGDPAFAAIRADFQSPKLAEAYKLDGMFSLNPVMTNLARLYQNKQALLFHAIATPYRARSHFDAQEVLENGMPNSGTGTDTGWLNRALTKMQPARGVNITPRSALAVAATAPLILRGAAPVESWQPQVLSYAQADTIARLEALYAARDPSLASALREGARVDEFLNDAPLDRDARRRQAGSVGGFPDAASAAARLMAAPDGPRIAAMNFEGWDTHMMQGPYDGRLAKNLQALDMGIAALEKGLGPAWAETTVLIVTEFGRTVHVNGSRGTDHGNGGVAMLVGGRVQGGRVVADWPGLADRALLDGRDLMPTTDLRAVLKGLLAAQLDLDERVMGEVIFPGSGAVKPMTGLVRA
ncbi:DUF1501 domain-containing protein [Acetobacteraceae bacterium H6797]|nr:DUF1501 domain-containing protein [Acetobacteraceae bacterium H6797]